MALLDIYSERRLLELAAQKDRGFTDETFAHALGVVRRIMAARWGAAGVDADHVGRITEVADQWRGRLLERARDSPSGS